MVINVLAIGDIGNIISTLSKFTKKSKIHIINFPKDGAGVFTYNENVETFENYKVKDHVEKINSIKNNFDIAITMGTGERTAYLADLNYIPFYVGRDIDAPRFIKNSTEAWFDEPLHTLNFLERKFYWNSFNFAIAHVAYGWVFDHLKKYTNDGIKMDMEPIDTTIFHTKVTPLKKEKKKFTFFSPQRMGLAKGTDVLWEAIKYCKTDFDIIQVDWRDMGTDQEKRTSLKIRESRPKQVKLIPMIKRNEITKYYTWADAVIGNLRIGTFENIEIESIFCKTPVINYVDKSIQCILENKHVESSFSPTSNEPKEIAKVIDQVVESKQFRDDLLEREREFVLEIANPEKFAQWWDSLFEQMVTKHKSIHRNSSKFILKLNLILFLIGNRLYSKKIFNFLINKFR
jgi:glycosyltransferase involved in cell wall biosynthesis